jgi:hypothetical protein
MGRRRLQPMAAGRAAKMPNVRVAEVQSAAGWAQANVQHCVCDRVASCCQNAWDIVCVQVVDALGAPAARARCCETGITQGCSDLDVESCVCTADPMLRPNMG